MSDIFGTAVEFYAAQFSDESVARAYYARPPYPGETFDILESLIPERPRSVLELADLLHPTPAVGGTPREDALAFLDKMESIDRGWYAGGLGWVGPSGDGEIALTLRCGLIRGNTATLYAGNGIVGASDPDEELFETRLKFRPMLDLLSAT